MATTRKQGADDQNQDATASTTNTQAQNHAQTPDQDAANRGAFAQSSYQNTQAGAHASTGSQPQGSQENQDSAAEGTGTNKMLDTALQAGKKWLADSGVLNNANQIPQVAKEWGTKAIGRVGSLSNTQKVVGGALLLAGVAYLTSRGKGKSSYSSASEDDSDYRSGSSYRQGGWAGYAGGKSASRRNAESGSRSEVSSYGTERRAATGSGYGRSTASSTDTDFGSGRESSGSPYANRRGADSSSNYSANTSSKPSSASTDSPSAGGSYNSGSRYEAGRSSSSSAATSAQAGRSASASTPNSNEQDYDA